MEYTAIIQKTDDGWYVGQCEQIPEALTQGETLDEMLENLKDAIKEAIIMRKEQIKEQYIGKKTFRRKVTLV